MSFEACCRLIPKLCIKWPVVRRPSHKATVSISRYRSARSQRTLAMDCMRFIRGILLGKFTCSCNQYFYVVKPYIRCCWQFNSICGNFTGDHMEPWVYGELVILALAVSGLICLVMQQKNLAVHALLTGQTQISELRRRTIIGLEHENAELKAMLRAHEAQLLQLSKRIESNEYALARQTRN